MNDIKRKTYLILLFFVLSSSLTARNTHRPSDPLMPRVTVNWVGNNKTYSLQESHLAEYPLFKLFDQQHFFSHQLPTGLLESRYNPKIKVHTAVLKSLIAELIDEIQEGKRTFKHFTVLQEKNFNRDLASGLLIVKFKKYPFVVKLFIETPESFVLPFDKGWEPWFLFFMSGGVNRHLSGFTRIKNLELVNNRINQSSFWSQRVDTPRKWFWLPPSSRWIKMTGYNIGTQEQITYFPGTYCIVADAIEADHILSIFNAQERQLALQLCNYLGMIIDAHINNFMIEKKSQKLLIVDTEHFPTIVGLHRKPPQFNSYTSWYLFLVRKCTKDMFLRTKKDRRLAQYAKSNSMQLL